MIGSIIGDVAGSYYEWRNIKSKEFPLFNSEDSFTDDSVMTVATADWVLNGAEGDAGRYYAKWGHKFPTAGYGGNFRSWLIRYYRDGYAEPYNSLGNGSAMRVGPIGWAFDTKEEVLQKAKQSAECTHNHPEGIKGAQAVALCIFMARHGATKDEIRSAIEMEIGYDLGFTIDEIRPTYGWKSEFGNGVTCMASVPQAIVAFLEAEDFIDAIRNAISIGGDSDTIACIAGSIAEAYYHIPQEIKNLVKPYLPEDFKTIINRFENTYQASGMKEL